MDLSTLTTLLAAGTAATAPTKAIVDAAKRAYPDMPPWLTLTLACLIGQGLIWLVGLAVGTVLTPAAFAGLVLAGLGATGGAVASTELHRAARPSAADPLLVAAVADDLERRMKLLVTIPEADPLISQPPVRNEGGGTLTGALVSTPASSPANDTAAPWHQTRETG